MSRYGWLGPPLAQAIEYGGLIALTAAVDRDALPACFAFLAAIAFHHYDLIYRAASLRSPPPRWISALGGGWELRLVAVGILAAAGVLEAGLVVGAAVLGAFFAGESTVSWVRSRGALLPAAERSGEAEALE